MNEFDQQVVNPQDSKARKLDSCQLSCLEEVGIDIEALLESKPVAACEYVNNIIDRRVARRRLSLASVCLAPPLAKKPETSDVALSPKSSNSLHVVKTIAALNTVLALVAGKKSQSLAKLTAGFAKKSPDPGDQKLSPQPLTEPWPWFHYKTREEKLSSLAGWVLGGLSTTVLLVILVKF